MGVETAIHKHPFLDVHLRSEMLVGNTRKKGKTIGDLLRKVATASNRAKTKKIKAYIERVFALEAESTSSGIYRNAIGWKQASWPEVFKAICKAAQDGQLTYTSPEFSFRYSSKALSEFGVEQTVISQIQSEVPGVVIWTQFKPIRLSDNSPCYQINLVFDWADGSQTI